MKSLTLLLPDPDLGVAALGAILVPGEDLLLSRIVARSVPEQTLPSFAEPAEPARITTARGEPV